MLPSQDRESLLSKQIAYIAGSLDIVVAERSGNYEPLWIRRDHSIICIDFRYSPLFAVVDILPLAVFFAIVVDVPSVKSSTGKRSR